MANAEVPFAMPATALLEYLDFYVKTSNLGIKAMLSTKLLNELTSLFTPPVTIAEIPASHI